MFVHIAPFVPLFLWLACYLTVLWPLILAWCPRPCPCPSECSKEASLSGLTQTPCCPVCEAEKECEVQSNARTEPPPPI